MHLCFSCITYLSFGTEIAGETKTQVAVLDLNQQQRARSIYRLHRFVITISQHLEFKVEIQNDPNKHITTTTESSVPWSDLNFAKVCSKTLLDSSALRWLLSAISYAQLYVVYSKLCRGKLFNRKRKPHTMSEKRHKINKFANYQKYNNEKQSRLGPPCFCSFSKPLTSFSTPVFSMVFDVKRMISTQFRWQGPCWSLCKLRLAFISLLHVFNKNELYIRLNESY